jgi:lipoprotein NlpI
MRFAVCSGIGIWLVLAGLAPSPVAAETVRDLLRDAKAAFDKGHTDQAIALTRKAIQLDPKNPKGYLARGQFYGAVGKPREAIADYTKVIALDAGSAEAYSLRGGEHFKLGHIKQSIADFDKQIALKPGDKAGHWRRGISYYYAGRFEAGRKQFEGYEAVDTNDVENAVWHFLCLARSVGVKKARKSMLKIDKDRRVPMMEVYALYAGKIKPEDVLTAAKKVAKGARPEAGRDQLFHAHLYLGLYNEVTRNMKRARVHMAKAAKDYVIGHYMGDVARVHLARMEKEDQK